MNFQVFKLDLEKAEEPKIKDQISISKVKRKPSEWETVIANEATDKELISKIYKQLLQLNFRKIKFQKSIYFCFIDYAKASVWITTNCKILRDGNSRTPDLLPEKPVCRSRGSSCNWTRNNRLVPTWERSTSRLYIVTLFV